MESLKKQRHQAGIQQSFIWTIPSLMPVKDFALPMSRNCFVFWTAFLVFICLLLVLLSWDCSFDSGDFSYLKLWLWFVFLAPGSMLPCSLNLLSLFSISCLPPQNFQSAVFGC